MPTRKLRSRALSPAFLSALSLLVVPSLAAASPVLMAGSGTEKVHSTHVSLLSNNGTNVVTIMPDYQGPLSAFAVIIPVPSDVTVDRVNTLKREFVDRLESISAPRFAEFWEMDPCESGPATQDWERNLSADASSAFLGAVQTEPTKKVAKELLLDVKAQTKEGEYALQVFGNAEEVKTWLSQESLSLPAGGDAALSEYAGLGFKFVVGKVDPNRVELVGGDRAQLSPIRYWTEQSVTRVPARFGLASAAPQQELFVYAMIQNQRMQIANYPTKAAPTNATVAEGVKERIGEFYAALQDRFLEKNPGTFLLEYAYSTAACGQPCPNEPLMPHELMSLGGDVIDSKLPKEEVRPAPPEPTEEELQKLEAVLATKKGKEKVDAKKDWETDREELVARRALLARHKYVLSRLHYRYGKEQLPKDPELGPGGAITGGVALPKGLDGAADPAVAGSELNEFQTRFNALHPSISQVQCDKPEKGRWGKPPSTYRGLRKIWIAEDLTRRNRKQIKLEDVVLTAIGDVGLVGKAAAAAAAAPAPTAPVEEKKEGCGCTAAGLPVTGLGAGLSSLLVGLLALRRRQRKV